MTEVLPCPVCGSMDVIHERESGDCCIEYWTEYECFGACIDDGPTFRTKHSWNQYAAAMEYTKAMVKREMAIKNFAAGNPYPLYNVIADHDEAKEQALKIFTEER